MKSHFLTTLYLLILISLGYITTDIYLPSLPALSVYFGATDEQVQLTLFAFLMSFSISPLFFGPLSDHIGRKKVVITGLLIGIAASFGCLFAPNIKSMIVFRLIQGFGLGAVLICARAITSDLFSGKELAKQMSLITMLMPLSLAIAPTIGGVLQEVFQWRAVFIFLICYLSIVLIWVYFNPESLKKMSDKKFGQIFLTYRNHLRNRSFLLYGINFVLPAFGIFSYLTVTPFLFQQVIGLSPIEYGVLSIYVGLTIIITGYINLKLLHHYPIDRIIFSGALFITLAGGLLLFFHFMGILTTWSLLFPCLLFYTCMPLCVSNSASKAMRLVHDHYGAASALLTTFQFLVGSLGSFRFVFIYDQSALPLALCFLFIGLLSLVNLSFACKQSG